MTLGIIILLIILGIIAIVYCLVNDIHDIHYAPLREDFDDILRQNIKDKNIVKQRKRYLETVNSAVLHTFNPVIKSGIGEMQRPVMTDSIYNNQCLVRFANGGSAFVTFAAAFEEKYIVVTINGKEVWRTSPHLMSHYALESALHEKLLPLLREIQTSKMDSTGL